MNQFAWRVSQVHPTSKSKLRQKLQ